MIAKVAVTDEEKKDAVFVRNNVFVIEQNISSDLEIDQHDSYATHVVLYNLTNEPIGAGRCRVVDGALKVERVCVLSNYRKTGAGIHIMEKMEDIARDFRLCTLKLNSQLDAKGFYEKLGYEPISDMFMEAGIPHVTMVKNLII